MHFFFTRRKVKNGKLTADVGNETRYLTLPHEGHNTMHMWPKEQWLDMLRPQIGQHGVAILVHGFNTSLDHTFWGLRKVKKGLQVNGFKGEVISFAWPNLAGGGPLKKYTETREAVAQFASSLYLDGAKIILELPESPQMHLVCHSMGAYVLRAALSGQTGPIFKNIAMFSADIEQKWFGPNGNTDELFAAWSARATNYYNTEDGPLGLAGLTKWPGPRVGKSGLPHPTATAFTDLDCTSRYWAFMQGDEPKPDYPSHTFYYQDAKFLRDLSLTLQGVPSNLRMAPPVPPDFALEP